MNATCFKLFGQVFECSGIFGNHHGSRCILVKSVNNARPNLTTNTFQIGTMIEQCVDHGTAAVPGCGMHNHTGLFVKYHDMAVLVYDLKGDGFGFIFNLRGVRNPAQDLIAAFYPVTGFFSLMVDKNLKVCN